MYCRQVLFSINPKLPGPKSTPYDYAMFLESSLMEPRAFFLLLSPLFPHETPFFCLLIDKPLDFCDQLLEDFCLVDGDNSCGHELCYLHLVNRIRRFKLPYT